MSLNDEVRIFNFKKITTNYSKLFKATNILTFFKKIYYFQSSSNDDNEYPFQVIFLNIGRQLNINTMYIRKLDGCVGVSRLYINDSIKPKTFFSCVPAANVLTFSEFKDLLLKKGNGSGSVSQTPPPPENSTSGRCLKKIKLMSTLHSVDENSTICIVSSSDGE